MTFEKNIYKAKNEVYFNHEREEMLEFIPLDVKSVLDVGCSSGGFGKLLKTKRNCEVWGVEPTSSSTIAAQYLDKVFTDYFHERINFGSKKFDAIVFNDVLEHLINPWEALELSKNLITPSGHVIASIPNVQCYSVIKDLIWYGNWNYVSSGIMDKTHLRFFTKKSIVKLFEDCGFEITEMQGQNSIIAGSRLLRFLTILAPHFTKPFTYINYAVRARVKVV